MPTRYRSLISDSARWDGFEFRPGDIIISTPPKCGTTWMQMICALLVFQTTDFRPAARPALAVARHAHPRPRRRVRRPGRPDAPPVHQDPHAARRDAERSDASRTSASGATRATSRCRGTTTSATWTSRRSSAPATAAVGIDDLAELVPRRPAGRAPDRRSTASGSGSTTRRRRRGRRVGGLGARWTTSDVLGRRATDRTSCASTTTT